MNKWVWSVLLAISATAVVFADNEEKFQVLPKTTSRDGNYGICEGTESGEKQFFFTDLRSRKRVGSVIGKNQLGISNVNITSCWSPDNKNERGVHFYKN